MRQTKQLNPLKRYASNFNEMRTLVTVIATALIISACASSGTPSSSGSVRSGNGSKISQCKTSDTLIQNSSQCLQDDAACYELSNGQWCTGERGNSCPAGSVAVPQGMACPSGKRCFSVGESLQCTISWSHYNLTKSGACLRTTGVLHKPHSLSLEDADSVLRFLEYFFACRARPQQQYHCTLIMPQSTR